jgi:hypothetical protein
MAISVQPVDGLINRLLQQNSRPASATDRKMESHTAPTQDQVSISPRAQSQAVTGPSQHNTGGKALESHLLNLYKMHDSYGA